MTVSREHTDDVIQIMPWKTPAETMQVVYIAGLLNNHAQVMFFFEIDLGAMAHGKGIPVRGNIERAIEIFLSADTTTYRVKSCNR
ncbi:hypothetical protein [Salinibacter altiplanensis]|uniref:hypothetical protein n=1 Tax=Salinibacter altiplanensis TaxID=1803181 RepID=UPI000C9F0A56|nr:hypothetical protein [Salinibacter altiplanensis]